MKRNNKKGFTIVELVIVIAVIGILAAVLIPTFGSVINNAKESAALQEARSIYTEYIAATVGDGTTEDNLYIKVDDYYFQVIDGALNDEPVPSLAAGTEFITGIDEDGSVESETVES